MPKSRLRSIAVLSAMMASGGMAYALDPGALPSGGQITSGNGNIVTSNSQMTVNQSSQQMIANWQSFNIGTDASVRFNQPGTTASALNRINDQNPSQIMGSLSANGQVFLLNQAGVVFGKSARIDVGGLVTSSLNMLDSDYLAGKFRFSATGTPGSIFNQGQISAMPGGVVAMIGPKVSNEGTITAPGGAVALAAGNQVSVDFKGDGLISLNVDAGAVDALAENKGLIKADGGMVVMTAKAADILTQSAVNNSGIVEAKSLQQLGGRIVLDTVGGTTTVSGTLDASSSDGKGGTVIATGDQVVIKDGAHLSASGATGGGNVLVGGSWQNSDPGVSQATVTTVEKGATLEANATDTGNGGTVAVWSDVRNLLSNTRVYGTLEAQGGPNGGDGGRIETSGHWLDVSGVSVSASALKGKGGLWLLDPANYTIDATAAGNISNALGGGTSVTVSTSESNSTYGGSALVGTYAGNITVASSISSSSASAVTLTLKANNDILLNPGIEIKSTSGPLNVVLWADSDATSGGSICLRGSSSITTKGGGLWMGGGSGTSSWTPYTGGVALTVGDGYATGGTAFTYSGESASGGTISGVFLIDSTLSTAGGNIKIRGDSSAGALSGSTYEGIISYGNLSIDSGSGTIVLDALGRGALLNSNAFAIEFGTASPGKSTTITSSSSSNPAIYISADASSATQGWRTGLLAYQHPVNILATGGGGITIIGKGGSTYPGITVNSASVGGSLNVLANGGAIQIDGGANGILLNGGSTIGFKASTLITSSSSDITLIADSLTLGSGDVIQSSGALTIKPYTASTSIGLGSGTGTLKLPASYFSTNFSNGFSSITVGGATVGSGSTFTGAISVDGLTFFDNIVLQNASGGITLAGTITDAGTGTSSGNFTALAGAGSISGSGSITGRGTSITFDQGGAGIYSGVLGGSAAFVKSGAGTLTLSGSNTYTGGTTLSAGVLKLGASNVLGDTGTLTVSGGTLDIGGYSDTVGSVTLSSGTITGTTGVLTASSYLATNSSAATISAILGGTAGLTMSGTGTLTLSKTNTYTGQTTIGAGSTLALSGTGSIAASSRVADAGTLDISLATSGASITTLSGTGGVLLGTQTLTLTSASDTFGGILSGTSGSLSITGGTETLTGSNTYTGQTTIGAGSKLSLSGTGSIAASSRVADAGTLDISLATSGASITTLSGTGGVLLGTQTLTLTSASDTFGGILSGTSGS
ncbi:MAG: filamentous hemagglutinin N-terminal domain-containing protein, partial [Chlorobiaceae bacterium]